MKKLILLTALMALPMAMFGQGQVIFANSTSPDSRFSTNSTPTPPSGQLANQVGNLSGVNTYLIGLYTAAAGTTDESLFILRLTATNRTGGAAGLFNGGNPATVNGIPINGTVAFQIRAWQTTTGLDTYENTTGQYKGKSAIGSVTGGDPAGGTPGGLFGVGAGQVLGVVLTPVVPEPSSIALGLLGLGAIALFRRRK